MGAASQRPLLRGGPHPALPVAGEPGSGGNDRTEQYGPVQLRPLYLSHRLASQPRRSPTLTVGNPYPKETRIYILPSQNNPLYRTYLEHTTSDSGPGETRKVKFMFEYDPYLIFKLPVAVGDITVDDSNRNYARAIPKSSAHMPNRARFASFIEDPFDPHRHAKDLLGGAEVEVVTGRKTRFEEFHGAGDRDTGRRDYGGGQAAGVLRQVILIFEVERNGKLVEEYKTLPLNSQGAFTFNLAEIKDKLAYVQGYYISPAGSAIVIVIDCRCKFNSTSKRGRRLRTRACTDAAR